MGHQISSDRQLGLVNRQSVQEKYHANLFLKNRKSSQQFQKEIHSVFKRSSYLHYEWAELLQRELKSSDPNQLYSQYQTTLKENCIRDGKKEKIFCPAKIQRQFICQLGERVKKQEAISAECLLAAYQETKCYFMVMSWLHKMVSLSSQDQQNTTRTLIQVWDLTQEGKIYEILLDLSQRTYRKCKEIIGKTEYEGKLDQLKGSLICLVKRLTIQKLKFFEKEIIVVKIQEELMKDLKYIDENVLILRKILGQDVIYSYLRTMREVGHFDVEFLWTHFGEELS